MSGVEAILGLVLAFFPLAETTFSLHKATKDRLAPLLNFDKFYWDLIQDVKDQKLDFQLHLKNLLRPLVQRSAIDHGKLEELLAYPGGRSWRHQDAEQVIKERLGGVYEDYMEVLKKLQEAMMKLLLSLGCESDDIQEELLKELTTTVPETVTARMKLMERANKSFLEMRSSLVERFKLSFSREHQQKALKDIRKHNETLIRRLALSDQANAVYPTSTTTIVSPAVKSLLQYREHATRIHPRLYDAWGCSCRHRHSAHVWLAHYPQEFFEFKVLVVYKHRQTETAEDLQWTQQGLQMKLDTTFYGPFHSNMPTTASVPPTPQESVDQNLPRKKPKRQRLWKAQVRQVLIGASFISKGLHLTVCRFAIQDDDAHTPQSRSVSATRESDDSVPWSGKLENLCTALSNSGMNSTYLGGLIDAEGKDCHSYSVWTQPQQKMDTNNISLPQILHIGRSSGLSLVKKLYLALAVASSHLKLVSTAWAPFQWGAADIWFPRSKTASADIFFEQPYVITDFKESENVEDSSKTRRTFVRLGIILLELVFGCLLERHPIWQDESFSGKENNEDFRLMVARQWADDLEDDVGHDFHSAVLWCLNESPSLLQGQAMQGQIVKRQSWQTDFYERVIVPLEHCHKFTSLGKGAVV